MSAFRINVIAVNPKREEIAAPAVEALVDAGFELTWLPKEILRKAEIEPRRKRMFQTATGEQVEREIGYAILRAEGFETTDEVVFAQKGDVALLGVRTLEGFSVSVDSIGHRLVAQTSLAC